MIADNCIYLSTEIVCNQTYVRNPIPANQIYYPTNSFGVLLNGGFSLTQSGWYNLSCNFYIREDTSEQNYHDVGLCHHSGTIKTIINSNPRKEQGFVSGYSINDTLFIKKDDYVYCDVFVLQPVTITYFFIRITKIGTI